MIEGLKCPPATHRYVPHGKVLVCTACADVQPLLLEVPTESRDQTRLPRESRSVEEQLPQAAEHEPSAQDLEAHIARLRDVVGLQEPLPGFGQRGVYEGNLEDEAALLAHSNERVWPRVPVDEGDHIDPRNDRVPDAGL